jgi:hypothetical protein
MVGDACRARIGSRSSCRVTVRLLMIVEIARGMESKLTFCPFGPSLTPQTADPQTLQCEQTQYCLSPSVNCKVLPAKPDVSGVSRPTGDKLLNLRFFFDRSPRPMRSSSPPPLACCEPSPPAK